MSPFIIGIDLGGTSAKFGLFDSSLNSLKQWRIPTHSENGGKQIIPDMIESLQEVLNQENRQLADCLGIGIGSPGSIHRDEGMVVGAYNLGWDTPVYVRKQLQEAFPEINVVIDNDANVAALGEFEKGAGEGADTLVMVTLGTGVGGGVIANGRLITGKGAAGEIGHMVVNTNEDAFMCTCGKRGCIETIASATGIANTALARVETYTGTSPLAEEIRAGKCADARMVFDSAKSGDDFAECIVSETMRYLGITLSQVSCVLDPDRIVIGGGVAEAGEYLLKHIEPTLRENTFAQIREGLELKLATLGNDAGLLGAAALVTKE